MAKRFRSVNDALVVGLIGYGAVALFYTLFDLAAARGTLHTVNVLGRAVFRGLRDPSVLQFPLELDSGAVFAYNALHLVFALVIGVIVAFLVTIGERHPGQRQAVRSIIVLGYVVTVVGVGLLTMPIRDVVPWWSIIVANALAATLAGAYLVLKHPGLWRRLALAEAEPA